MMGERRDRSRPGLVIIWQTASGRLVLPFWRQKGTSIRQDGVCPKTTNFPQNHPLFVENKTLAAPAIAAAAFL